MKIAFVYDLVYPYSKGGVEKRIWDLAHALSSKGHEVHILGTHCWDGDADQLVDGVRYRGIAKNRRIYSNGGRRSVSQAVRFAFSVGRSLAGSRFDVVELQGMAPLSCLAALTVCRLTKREAVVIWYEVWRDYWNHYLGLLGFVGRSVEWMVSRLAPVNVAVSNLAASRLRVWGVDPVPLLPIGVDLSWIQSVPAESDGSDVLYVGRLASHKNLQLLVESVSMLRAEGIEPVVHIVGEGPERDALEQRAWSAGMANIRFLGRVESHDEVISMMKSSRVFAFPSLREGFGLAALEAGACGLPVVAVAHSDNATLELIEDGVNGFVTASDARDFARALRTLLVDNELRDRMGRDAINESKNSHGLT